MYGLRFDLSIIFSSNLLFILLSLLPIAFFDSKPGQQLLKVIYFVVNTPLLLMNIADVEYFKFTAKRTGYNVIGILQDVTDQSFQLIIHYWYMSIVVLLVGFLLYNYYGSYRPVMGEKLKKGYAWSILFFVILLSILIIRGGFQYKPLKPDHAFVLKPNVLGHLVLNTPYNFFTTLSYPRTENVFYFKTEEEVKKIIDKSCQKKYISPTHTNVVIIILESFSREYMGIGNGYTGYTPFLDSLAKSGTFFDHHFANGKTSIDAVPSILASIPALMDEPFISGIYQSNEIHGVAELLESEGYHTAFFHGGRNGTMGFDKFALRSGFKEYYGLDEYPEADRDFDGSWGIYDEPYLNYFCRTISTFKEPFLASVFTLSSHQPYKVPEKYKGKFPKGTLEIHESIGYADYALKKFFECAATQSWYKNTLFVITADHTQILNTPKYSNIIGEFRVPLLLFHSGRNIMADTSQVTQHLDILPTVIDYEGIENKVPILFGQSVLDTTEGKALYYINNTYVYVKKDYFMESDHGTFNMYAASDWNRKQKIMENPGRKAQYEKELKAFIQYYNNGLNNNNWYHY